jgi:glycosyltransferase involved in cell wall biosynthesis
MSVRNGVNRKRDKMERINVHMFLTPFIHETRMLRITNSLAQAKVFDKIYIIACLRDEGVIEHESLDEKRQVWRVPTVIKRRTNLSKTLNMLEWSLRAWRFLRDKEVKCVNPHSFAVLPLAVIFKLFKGCHLIYDTHEIETETGETVGMRGLVSKFLERLLVRFADAVAVTSDGHGKWYRREYDLKNVWVIKNFPYRVRAPLPKENILKKQFHIGKGELLFIYQGLISKGRGTDLLMRVFAKMPKDKHIVFMGFGEDVDTVKAYAKMCTNIHYYPAVKPHDVPLYTSGADVGIHMMDDSCINHLYALPNKPMEYMNAGVPAIVSNLPDMSALIREAGAGWIIPVNDENRLAQLVYSLTPKKIVEKQAKAFIWSKSHNWEGEEKKLLAMYRQLKLRQ